MSKFIVFLLAVIVLCGCAPTANYQVLKLGSIDITNKTITVPGAGNALFEIKTALINDGWKLKVGDASLEETGVNTSNIKTTTKVQYDTAYRMYLASTLSINDNYGITTSLLQNDCTLYLTSYFEGLRRLFNDSRGLSI